MSDFFDFQQILPDIIATPPTPRYRLGTVSAVNTDRTINVTIGASTTIITSVKYLGNVQPLPGAPIWLVSDGFDMFAIGVIGAADRTFSPRTSRSTDQNIADSTDTVIGFDAVNSDSWGSWNGNQRLTARMTGRHIAVGTVAFAANGVGWRAAWIERTGTSVARQQVISAASGSPTHINVTSHPIDMVAGTDYVTLNVRHNSGGALAVSTIGAFSPSLSLIYLGP